MIVKTFLLFCASAILVKEISCQYFGAGSYGPSPFTAGPYGAGRFDPVVSPYGPGLPCSGIASSGGSFIATSVSPIAPTGLTVVSENVIEGELGAGGQLPFLGTVALEGAFSTAGVGAISYGCGSGAVGITSEGPLATGILGQGLVGTGLGLTPLGCGCAK